MPKKCLTRVPQMNCIKTTLIALFLAFGLVATASAEDATATVEQGCEVEIKQFWSQVTLGEDRLLACLYAHEDKLSGQCHYTLDQASDGLANSRCSLSPYLW